MNIIIYGDWKNKLWSLKRQNLDEILQDNFSFSKTLSEI